MSSFRITKEDAQKIPAVMEEIEAFLTGDVSNESFQLLCDKCLWLIDRIPLPMHYVDSTFIVRARENFNGEVFSEQWQISYHTKDFEKIKVGRFNRPQEPMFYGALKGNDHKGDNVPTATMECCKRILDETNTDPYFDFTLGRWQIRKPFHVINLLYHDQTLLANPHIAKYLEDFFGAWEKKFSKEVSQSVRDYMRFFSKVSATEKPTDNHYMISNAFWASVRAYHKRYQHSDIHGIIYPSWITEWNGINIAMPKTAVDELLNLDGVGMYTLTRNPNNAREYFGAPWFEDLVPVINGSFTLPSITP